MLILSAGAVSAEGFNTVAGEDMPVADDVADDDATGDDGEDVSDDDATGDDVSDHDTPEVIAAPDDASGNATGSSSNLSKNPTANPILVLLAAIASVGIASIKRK